MTLSFRKGFIFWKNPKNESIYWFSAIYKNSKALGTAFGIGSIYKEILMIKMQLRNVKKKQVLRFKTVNIIFKEQKKSQP